MGENLTLDVCSFELVRIPTVLSTDDFYKLQDAWKEDAKSVQDLKQRYYAEVETFVKQKLKCDKVVFLHHQVRRRGSSYRFQCHQWRRIGSSHALARRVRAVQALHVREPLAKH